MGEENHGCGASYDSKRHNTLRRNYEYCTILLDFNLSRWFEHRCVQAKDLALADGACVEKDLLASHASPVTIQ